MNFFKGAGFSFELHKKAYVMGILNITPDSFSDNGKYFETDTAVSHALLMQKQGADIIDIGAQSTRPGAKAVSGKQEIERLLPVLNALKGKLNIPISVDTFYPEVANFALENGAVIINDVSGVLSEEMANIIKKHNAGWVIMHNTGGAATVAKFKNGVLADVKSFFESALSFAQNCSIPKETLCFDVGIGFGKSYEDNLKLIRDMKNIKIKGNAMLVGASKKRVVGIAANEPNAEKRTAGTVAAHTLAIAGGADIIRVHDVREAVQAAKVAEAIIYG
ncbi:MAG TPA: dihydropteroate synthase [Clostridia bacterium]|nr:dihydropteroate synthase [Clostridia bacterium]